MSIQNSELHPATQAAHQLSGWHDTGRFLMERRRGGSSEALFTTFDHAHIAARLYDITGCSEMLDRSISTIVELAQSREGGCVWSFSDAVPDIPPDADSTANCLLLLQRGVELGLEIDEHLHPANCVAQFEQVLTQPHGIHTFFGDRAANDVDPLVNIGVAELVIRTGVSFSGMSSIVDFLNARLADYQWGTRVSEYYLGASFLAERLTTLVELQPDILHSQVIARMDNYLCLVEPTDALALALIAVACRRRGFLEQHRTLVDRLSSERGTTGPWWGFAPIYIQRTPRYEYGSDLLTTLLAIQAGAETAGALR